MSVFISFIIFATFLKKKLNSINDAWYLSLSTISYLFSLISVTYLILSMMVAVGNLGILLKIFSISPLGLENIVNSSELSRKSNLAIFLRNLSRQQRRSMINFISLFPMACLGGTLGMNMPGHRLQMATCRTKKSLYLRSPSHGPCLSTPLTWQTMCPLSNQGFVTWKSKLSSSIRVLVDALSSIPANYTYEKSIPFMSLSSSPAN